MGVGDFVQEGEVMREKYLKMYHRGDGHRIVTHEIVNGEVCYQHWPPGEEVQGFEGLYRCEEPEFDELIATGGWTEHPVQPAL